MRWRPSRRSTVTLPAHGFDKPCGKEHEKSDDGGSDAVNAEGFYDERLQERGVKRKDDAEESEPLEYAAHAPVHDEQLKKRKNEYYAVKKDAVFRYRNAE